MNETQWKEAVEKWATEVAMQEYGSPLLYQAVINSLVQKVRA